jgi:hypothetical protein
VVSIAALLGVMLDLIAPPFESAAPKWEVLKDLNSMFVIAGFLGWGVCSLLWFRWLGTHVPAAETRRAVLKPRAIRDYLSLPWRVTVPGLTALYLGIWLLIGAFGYASGPKLWGGLAFFTAMSALFAFFASMAPRRRPGYLDRMFGDAYRRGEIRAAYAVRLLPVVLGSIVMAELLTGANLARLAQLLVVSFVCVLALMVLRLRPVAPASGATPGYGTFAPH